MTFTAMVMRQRFKSAEGNNLEVSFFLTCGDINTRPRSIFITSLIVSAKNTPLHPIMYKIVVVAAVLGLAVADNINRDAEIRSLVNDVGPDGSFRYGFETSNGIAVSAQGNALGSAGSAQWISPEGTPVAIQYTADENGYVATGDFVPKTPEYILRALEWIKAHPQKDEYVEPQAASPQRRF